MIRNYLKIAWRNFARHKGFTFINIAGLSIGLACSILLTLYVKDELSYDRSHAHADRIYRLNRTFISKDGTPSLKLGHVAPPFGPLVKGDFPEVKEVVRMFETSVLVRYKEHLFKEDHLFAAEPSVFNVFSVNVLKGNPAEALKNPFSIMFSKTVAEKYFGSDDPIGKTVRLDNQLDYLVTGVFESFPVQSSLHPEILVSFSTLEDDRVYGAENLRTNWSNNAFSTFVLLQENHDAEKLTKAFPAFLNRHIGPKSSEGSVLSLTRLTDIHLKSHLDSEIEANGDIQYVYLFSAIAAIILVIACINYMNLSTARAARRAREVGMRKAVGAMKTQLIGQFLSESFLVVGVSLLLSIVLLALAIPFVNSLAGKQLSMATLTEPFFVATVIAITVFTSLAAGFYPAFVITSYEPVSALKGSINRSLKSGNLRHVLVVTQFTIAVALIICTAVVFSQVSFIRNFKLGLSKDQVMVFRAPDIDSTGYETLRQEFMKDPAVLNVGRSSRIPSGNLLDSWEAYVTKNGQMATTDVTIKSLQVDEEFVPLYKIKMAAGRSFSKDFPTDKGGSFILNETAVRLLGWQDPARAVGEKFAYGQLRGNIIGVARDFNFESLHKQIPPVVLFMNGENLRWLSVEVSGKDASRAINHISSVWKARFPDQPFGFGFLDQRFGHLYEKEHTQKLLFGCFAGLAIFISCLGLFGLSVFVAELRIKEVGVRKVLGASVVSLVSLLSSDFMKLVLIAILIASPLAWYIMDWWLKDFAYKTPIHWWIFLVSGSLALMIAFVTVSFQSIRAALINPVISLKSE